MPTLKQIQTLRDLLVEFYLFQKEHYKNDKRFLQFVEENLKDPLNENRSEFHSSRLELLDIADEFPVAHRNDEGKVVAVQLRPITKSEIIPSKVVSYASAAKNLVDEDLPRKLLLGCGNNPTSVCFHYPTIMNNFSRCCRDYFQCETDSNIIINQVEKDLEDNIHHHHNGFITIDPNIVMNPTVVAEFGEWKLPFLPDNYFDSVENEGIYLGTCKYYKEEEKRILRKKANL